jgi:two-component system, chemotaxis family, protein-glutamate methylesterase/glutaminase
MTRIRVLVVDDSALMRKMIPQILSSDEELEVVGTAMDGVFALKKMRELKPDVVTLDVSMPRMDGIETLRHIVEDFGTPAVIVSSLAQREAELTFQALEIGAFDFVTKPQDAISVHITEIGEELISKVKAAHSNPLARLRVVHARPVPVPVPVKKPDLPTGMTPVDRLLVIGISTGGPNALSYLLPQVPKDFPAGILIVQHMPPGFTEMFAARLNASCRIEVKEAKDGDLVLPGRALIAPGDRHLKVKRMALGTIAVLSDAPPVSGHRPSADVLFRSAAAEYGDRVTGVIMTGMGSDGAEGIGEIKARGGMTVAQDEASCIVFGMPKVAIEKGYIAKVVSLGKMGNFITDHFLSNEEVAYGALN